MSLEARLLRCWYSRWGWCWLLIPFSLLFSMASRLRRAIYALRPAARLPVPVIVVGNLAVGGTGKTPLVIWMVERLRAAGHRPGVISRGYGASARAAVEVGPDSQPGMVGDEPILIVRRGRCPVWVGRRRAEAGSGLLKAHPEVDVIVSDDGLQHYALARDMEIVVVDGRRGFGNGLLLPAGPLREGLSRLDAVAAVVVNGDGSMSRPGVPVYSMQLIGARIYNLMQPARHEPPTYFSGRPVHAVAAIGNPARFFETLGRHGIAAIPHAFPDHHSFRPDELPTGTVIMTEKDAVKCTSFGRGDIWAFSVDAEVSEGLEQQVLDQMDKHHG